MQLKMTNLKSIISNISVLVFLAAVGSMQAQEVIVTDSTALQNDPKVEAETVQKSERFKVDGVAAVVGDFVVLESDIDKMYIELQSQGVSIKDVTNCNLAGRLMEDKLYAHHAIQDSIVVSDAEINATVDQQLAYMTQQVGGSMEKVLEFYKKDNEAEFRTELFEINKQNRLASEMQRKIVDAVEVTPEEVRTFFSNIPEDERPVFGDEVEIAQIVVKPEIPESEKQKIINRLKEMRADIVDNGASFATKAVLYSQDATRSTGGKMTLTRKDPIAKEFKDLAFSLQEGEVSQPFETQFGYHLLTVDKIRGQQVDVRHIILIPDVTDETKKKALEEIESVRKKIKDGEITFAAAAKEVSDEKETRESGGKLINPTTGDTRFELTKVDPLIYDQVVNLKEGEVSLVLTDQDNTGRPFYKIITVTNRYPEHKADYAKDYNKIKELALRDKQLKAIEKWQKEKITNTYVKVNGDYRECEYTSNWVKN